MCSTIFSTIPNSFWIILNHFWVQDSKLLLGFCDIVTKTEVFFTVNNNNFDELAQFVKKYQTQVYYVKAIQGDQVNTKLTIANIPI